MVRRYAAVPYAGAEQVTTRHSKRRAIRDAKLMRDKDSIVVRIDGPRRAAERVWTSPEFHERKAHEMYLQGLRQAHALVGHDVPAIDDAVEHAKDKYGRTPRAPW